MGRQGRWGAVPARLALALAVLLAWGVWAEALVTSFYWDFEDGVLSRWTGRTSMAVPPKLILEDGNYFMRITKSVTDCDSIPAEDCGTRSRTTVSLTESSANMPLISDANNRQTYSARVRYDNNSGARGDTFELTMRGTLPETYSATNNGTGPVTRLWRVDGDVQYRINYDNQSKVQSVTESIPAGQWHTYTVKAVWSANPAIGRVEWSRDGVVKNLRLGNSLLGDDSNRIPQMKVGMYSNNIPAGSTVDYDNLAAYPTDAGAPDPPGTETPTPTTRYAAPSGSGTACSQSTPCSWSTMISQHNGGDTLRLTTGTYPVECNGCLKNGTASRPTVLESVSVGSAITVGARGVSVNPGLAVLAPSTTGHVILMPAGSQYITVRQLTVAPTGDGTNAPVRIGNTTSTALTHHIVFDNVEITAPARTGSACLRTSNVLADVTLRRLRVHHCGPAVTSAGPGPVYGLELPRTRITLEDSDVYANASNGVNADCVGCTPDNSGSVVAYNRIFGNGGEGLVVGDGTDQRVHHNIVYENNRRGIWVNAGARRIEVYNNSVDQNNRQFGTGGFAGLQAENGSIGVLRNAIVLRQITPISLPATAGSWACSHNLVGTASLPTAVACTTSTFNATHTQTWVDATNATLAGRNYALVTSPTPSPALDNGTAAVCSSTDTGANRCSPGLTLSGFQGAGVDQGAIEVNAPVVNQLIGVYGLNNAVTDASAQGNDGTATSVDFDATNTAEGSHSALFNDANDRISIPLKGYDLMRGLTIALFGRVEALGSLRFMFGHTASAPGWTHRIQMKLDAQNRYFLGIGDTRDALVTSFTAAAERWYLYGLVLHASATDGTVAYDAYVDGVKVGSGTAHGLSVLAETARLGSDGSDTGAGGWGLAGNAQLDDVRVWNYPKTAAEMAEDCDARCVTPPPPGEALDISGCAIGTVSNQVVDCVIDTGATTAICSPLSNWQVTCGGVAQTETSCSVTGVTPPHLRVNLSAACAAGEEVVLTYATSEDPFPVANLIQVPCGTMDMLSCETSVNGLTVECLLRRPPCGCPLLTNFRLRDDCMTKALTACALTPMRLQLTRATPPAVGAVLDLLYLPTDQRLEVTNAFDPNAPPPEDPPTTGMHQPQWRFRPVGRSDATPYDGLPATPGAVASPGALGARLAVANQSGATVTGLKTSLWASRRLPGGNFSAFVRVEGGTEADAFNSLGLRYDPPAPYKIADNASLPVAALPLAGLTERAAHRYRRSAQAATAYTLSDDEQVEEEHAVELSPGVPLETAYVLRLRDHAGVSFADYAGVVGCTNDPEPFGPGDTPCGALFVVRPPRRR